MSYAKGSTDRPLLELTVGALLDQTALRYPDNDALISLHQGLRYSYREFQAEVDRCARALLAIGLKKGDRIGIWSPNYAEWTILQFASSKVGAILVNINPSYRVHELEFALQLTGCAALVLATQFRTSNYADMLRELAPELDHCAPGQLLSQRLPALHSVIRLGDEADAGMWRWKDFLHLGNQVSSTDLAQRHHGAPEGGHAQPLQHCQQRRLRC
jgi:fatty-acyl-CoA synthase